jgi:hypothetical protein
MSNIPTYLGIEVDGTPQLLIEKFENKGFIKEEVIPKYIRLTGSIEGDIKVGITIGFNEMLNLVYGIIVWYDIVATDWSKLLSIYNTMDNELRKKYKFNEKEIRYWLCSESEIIGKEFEKLNDGAFDIRSSPILCVNFIEVTHATS